MGFLSNIFKGPPATAPAPPPPAPVVRDYGAEAAAEAAAEKQRKAAAVAVGRQSTVLTGGMGDTSTAPTTKRTLLGE